MAHIESTLRIEGLVRETALTQRDCWTQAQAWPRLSVVKPDLWKTPAAQRIPDDGMTKYHHFEPLTRVNFLFSEVSDANPFGKARSFLMGEENASNLLIPAKLNLPVLDWLVPAILVGGYDAPSHVVLSLLPTRGTSTLWVRGTSRGLIMHDARRPRRVSDALIQSRVPSDLATLACNLSTRPSIGKEMPKSVAANAKMVTTIIKALVCEIGEGLVKIDSPASRDTDFRVIIALTPSDLRFWKEPLLKGLSEAAAQYKVVAERVVFAAPKPLNGEGVRELQTDLTTALVTMNRSWADSGSDQDRVTAASMVDDFDEATHL